MILMKSKYFKQSDIAWKKYKQKVTINLKTNTCHTCVYLQHYAVWILFHIRLLRLLSIHCVSWVVANNKCAHWAWLEFLIISTSFYMQLVKITMNLIVKKTFYFILSTYKSGKKPYTTLIILICFQCRGWIMSYLDIGSK